MREKKLSDLKKGQEATVLKIQENCSDAVRQRMLDLGFVKGARIVVENTSPLNDPVAYNVHHTQICLRRKDASQIWIEVAEGV
tara:strand:- start:284 stop:532 length:249 start_codon:yes stop_codon:yes gene_type:complete